MKLTVLICVHSTDERNDIMLRRALLSLVEQTYKAFNVVIILDSCWPETKQVIEDYSDSLQISSYEHQKVHLSQAKNFGLRYCDCDYVMMLDHDDSYHKDKVLRQVEFIKDNPNVDFLFCQAYDCHQDGSITPNCFSIGKFMNHWEIQGELSNQNCLHHGTACIKMKALKELGGYPEGRGAVAQEDYLLWQYAISRGYKFFNLPIRMYYHSLGTSTVR